MADWKRLLRRFTKESAEEILEYWFSGDLAEFLTLRGSAV
jgi:hypothetical protein